MEKLGTTKKVSAILSAAVLVLAIAALSGNPQVSATHQPANKIAVSASGLDILDTSVGGAGSDTATGVLLLGTLKTSNPTDLIIMVTLECALWTNLKTAGAAADSTAQAQVLVWIEIDGVVLPISSDDTNGTGKVVFCNRDFRIKYSGLNDATILELFLKTRSTHAFNYIAISPFGSSASNMHTIKLWAEVKVLVQGDGSARALIGKRTMVVSPEKLANDISI